MTARHLLNLEFQPGRAWCLLLNISFLSTLADEQDGMVRDRGHPGHQAKIWKEGKCIISAWFKLLVRSDSCIVLINPVTLVEDAYLREGLLICLKTKEKKKKGTVYYITGPNS